MSDNADIITFPTQGRSASLPMYVLPEMEASLKAWWHGLAGHFRDAGLTAVPDTAQIPADLLAHWLSGGLLFSQTCGFPLTHLLKGRVTLLATPSYAAPGCEDAWYRSMVIVPDSLDAGNISDLAGLNVAVNGWDSQSGFIAFRALVGTVAEPGMPFFARTIISDGHLRSIEAVQSGDAQCAAIDGVTLALVQKHRPDALKGVRTLCTTVAAPGLPYISRGNASEDDLARLREGLFAALADPALQSCRDDLLLTGAKVLRLSDYERILEIERAGADVIF